MWTCQWPLSSARYTGRGLLFLCTGERSAQAQSPRAALEPQTGHWKGPFGVYTHDGKQVDSLSAEHRYRWEDSVQVGTQVDRSPDGRVVRKTARNYVTDEGRLICEVDEPGGPALTYRGQVSDGVITWHRTTDAGVVESFRERVVDTPTGPEYRIDGFGVYPSEDGTRSYLHFVGRYRAVHQDVSTGRE
ncbi:hypothetical protein [Salinibacter altiplanensis]|uniref:hypothetical protein n=1 Tax=Salinibacter altiplanensis TaxID=1803181 RepID=UPI001E4E92BE|nr:hypothetical protein [Salinibacter altiplanensis]